jgi:thioredoxin 1
MKAQSPLLNLLNGPHVGDGCADTDETYNAVENMNSNEHDVRIVEIGEANFYSEVVQSKRPVLVAFMAPRNQPFQVLKAVLDEVVTAGDGGVKVAWVNTDDNPNLGMWYGIRSSPTLLYFVDARPRARVVGTASKEAILSQLKPLTETP